MWVKVFGGLAIVVGAGGLVLGYVGFPGLDFLEATGFVASGVTAIWGADKAAKLKALLESVRK